MNRRSFVKGSFAAGAVSVAIGAGLLAPRAVLAAWPKSAFMATDVDTSLSGAVGSTAHTASDKIKIKAPDIAENGSVVPVSVTTSLKAESITLFASKNNNPLAANFLMGATAEGFVSTRVKMAKTSDVIAVVKSGGKLYSAKKNVKVTIGGCGG